MSPPTAPPDVHDKVQQAAARWFARLRGSDVTEAQRARFAHWLNADEAHGREYAALEEIWAQSGQLAGQTPVSHTPPPGRRARRVGAACLLGGLMVWLGLLGAAEPEVVIATAPGEVIHRQLADGSGLDLAPRSRLQVAFDGSRRRLRLERGQLAVDVADDPRRPLEVLAGGVVIRDVGTRFDVLAEGSRVQVTVAQGQVDIEPQTPGGPRQHLQAGESADIQDGSVIAVRPVERATALAWTRGMLSVDNLPLGELLTTLNRYRKTPVELEDEGVGKIRLSGVFRLDNETDALRALEAVAPVRFIAEGGRVRALPRP